MNSVVLLALLITVLATALLILYVQKLPPTARFRRPRGGVIRDAEFGLAELTLPPGWRPDPTLNEGAPLQAVDPLRDRYILIMSEARDDFDPAMGIEEHSACTRELLTSSVRLLATRGPDYRQVAGFNAIQYEIDAMHDSTRITYLHTTIAGRRAFHQVITWAPRSRYDRSIFEELLDGFREPPGPEPNLLSPEPEPMHVNPASEYDVH